MIAGRSTARARGAGQTEWLVLVVLVSIAVLLGVRVFGYVVEERYHASQIEVRFELVAN